MKISATIICFNEEQRIGACLRSLDFVDEIVVVDSGSTDRTEEICRSHPLVSFYRREWLGFGRQKNLAIDLASHPWILSVDADESVSAPLAEEIRTLVDAGSEQVYAMRRKNFYREQWIRHCGWWPDWVVRLFPKSQGRFSERPVHETLEFKADVVRLQGSLEHRSFAEVGDFIRKMDQYSTLGAEQLKHKGRSFSAIEALGRAAFTFVKTYVIKGGVLDGRAGLLIACSNAGGVFYRYMKYLDQRDGGHGT